jgi:uncharacterized protein YggE
MRCTSLLCLLTFAGVSFAQTAAQTARTVQATGTATLNVTPNQAALDIGVVTAAATAQDSAQQNATQTTAVLNAVKAVIGGTGSIQTLYYSISPRYVANTSTINGYITTNTLRATTTDLSIIGRIVDAANGAGANSVGSLSFGLQNQDPWVQQALAAAAKQAMGHAAAIASGLGTSIGTVVSAQEGSGITPVGVAATGAVTPIQTGTVSVSATVTLVVQLM